MESLYYFCSDWKRTFGFIRITHPPTVLLHPARRFVTGEQSFLFLTLGTSHWDFLRNSAGSLELGEGAGQERPDLVLQVGGINRGGYGQRSRELADRAGDGMFGNSFVGPSDNEYGRRQNVVGREWKRRWSIFPATLLCRKLTMFVMSYTTFPYPQNTHTREYTHRLIHTVHTHRHLCTHTCPLTLTHSHTHAHTWTRAHGPRSHVIPS